MFSLTGEYKKDELLESARSGNEEKMMSLLSPLNVNCHASDGRKVVNFLCEIYFYGIESFSDSMISMLTNFEDEIVVCCICSQRHYILLRVTIERESSN